MKRFIYFILLIGIVSIAGCVSNSSNEPANTTNKLETEQTQQEENLVEIDKTTSVEQENQTLPVPPYKVVYSLSNKRYDGGENYYVLTDSVDLNNKDFKEGIKLIVIDMVKKNGAKISIEIHDDVNSLNVSYKEYGDMSLNRPTTDQENKFMSIHHIATFQGDLETGLYLNTLYYFPNSGLGTQADKYTETIEFNIEK